MKYCADFFEIVISDTRATVLAGIYIFQNWGESNCAWLQNQIADDEVVLRFFFFAGRPGDTIVAMKSEKNISKYLFHVPPSDISWILN